MWLIRGPEEKLSVPWHCAHVAAPISPLNRRRPRFSSAVKLLKFTPTPASYLVRVDAKARTNCARARLIRSVVTVGEPKAAVKSVA